jgi:hypothetical protein
MFANESAAALAVQNGTTSGQPPQCGWPPVCFGRSWINLKRDDFEWSFL